MRLRSLSCPSMSALRRCFSKSFAILSLARFSDKSLNIITKLIGLVMIFKDLSEKRANERMAKDFEKQRLSALIEGQERERSRIAKDLHDGLGQILNAVKMNVNVLV